MKIEQLDCHLTDSNVDEINDCLSEFGNCSLSYNDIMTFFTENYNVIIFIAKDDDFKIRGFCMLVVDQKLIHSGSRVARIEEVCVNPNFQGRGIGKLLLKECVAKAKELGCYKVMLNCSDSLEQYYIKNRFFTDGKTMRINL